MKKVLLLALALLPISAFAQIGPRRVTGTITAVEGTLKVPCGASIGVNLAGTWTGTIVAELSADGGLTQKGVRLFDYALPRTLASVTANGTYAFTDTAGGEICQVRASALASGTVEVSLVVTYPPGAPTFPQSVDLLPGDVELEVSSANAAAANNQTLAASAGARTYITGFSVTGAGATAGSTIAVTITGLTTTLTYHIVIPAGAGVSLTQPLVITFTRPIPASADNTAIVVNVPSFGAGNTAASATAVGFRR